MKKLRMWRYWCMYCDKYSEVIISETEPEDAPLCCNDTRMTVITEEDEK